MPRSRLFLPQEIDGWKQTVRTVMEQAQAQMGRRVERELRAHGLTWASPRTGRASSAWSQTEWATIVHQTIRPVALKLAAEVFATAHSRVTVPGPWGGRDDQRRLAGLLVDQVIAGGSRIAEGLGAPAALTAASSPPIVHPDAQPTIAHAYQAAFDQLNKLASSVASHMSNAAQTVLAETATQYEPLIQNVWCCSFVPASRDSHMEADSQAQNAGDPFEVGDELLMYPGDPDGSDEETANCLCWLEITELEVAVPDAAPVEEDAIA